MPSPVAGKKLIKDKDEEKKSALDPSGPKNIKVKEDNKETVNIKPSSEDSPVGGDRKAA